MMVLITYDVETITPKGQKRLRRVAKECVNYGHRVQNSVFECMITEAQFVELKAKLNEIINAENDSIRFYKLGNHWESKITQIGKETALDFTSELII